MLMTDNNQIHQFNNNTMLSEQLAKKITTLLEKGINEKGNASLVLSGGKTPILLYEKLSCIDIDWSKVFVTLTDERWVSMRHDASNEKMLRTHFLINFAQKAHFIGLYNMHRTAKMGVDMTNKRLSEIPLPIDVVVLGMGEDGHTASLFPCSKDLDNALKSDLMCTAVMPTTASFPRLTLTYNMLSQAQHIFLHIVGENKLETLNKAKAQSDIYQMPIKAFLDLKNTPISIYWSKE